MSSLWPNIAGMIAPRGMFDMLSDAVGGIGSQTNGAVDFYIDILGVGRAGVIQEVRHNCYLRVAKKDYLFLFFQVTTPVAKPFPAVVATPEEDPYPEVHDEPQLLAVLKQVLERERTKEVVLYLLALAK
jgi:hypothetical protein